MSIEAMKQAVVYFEHMVRTLKLRDQSEPAQLLFKLRQAIEQAKKQDVEQSSTESKETFDQPVAWGMQNDDGKIYDCITPEEHARLEGEYKVPLYTAPPAAQREWVALPDEEIDRTSWDFSEYEGFQQGARWAQDQLREKNGGNK